MAGAHCDAVQVEEGGNNKHKVNVGTGYLGKIRLEIDKYVIGMAQTSKVSVTVVGDPTIVNDTLLMARKEAEFERKVRLFQELSETTRRALLEKFAYLRAYQNFTPTKTDFPNTLSKTDLVTILSQIH